MSQEGAMLRFVDQYLSKYRTIEKDIWRELKGTVDHIPVCSDCGIELEQGMWPWCDGSGRQHQQVSKYRAIVVK